MNEETPDRTIDDESLAAELDAEAFALLEQGRAGPALPLLERALAILEHVHASPHPDVANVLVHLAQVHLLSGRPASAETVARRARQLVETVLERDAAADPAFALDDASRPLVQTILQQALDQWATALRASGRYDEALAPARAAAQWAERTFGSEHPELAFAWNNLGVLHKYRGEYEEAGLHYGRARELLERVAPEGHPALADVTYNLAGLLHAQGDFRRAEPLARRALALTESLRPGDHPDVGVRCLALGAVLEGARRHAEAGTLYERALGIFETSFGPDHPDVAHTLHNTAELRRAEGRLDEAERLHRRALAIRQRVLGERHPDVGTSSLQLGRLLVERGRKSEARTLLDRAAVLFEALPSSHPRRAGGRDRTDARPSNGAQ